MLASHTEVIASSASQQTGLVVAPSATPTIDPNIFSMNGAITYQAPNGLFSVKIPKSWRQAFNGDANNYSFTAGDLNTPSVVLDIECTDLVKFSKQAGLALTPNSPRELLDAVKERFVSSSGGSASQIYSARVGTLTGLGVTITTRENPAQVADLRVAEIGKGKIVLTLSYSSTQAWPYAKPILERALLSLSINPQNLPTITPTQSASMLALVPSSFDDIRQITTADGSPIVGDPSAGITILEFVDFSCPHCLDYQSVIEFMQNKEYMLNLPIG